MTAYGEQPELLWKPGDDARFSRVEHFRRYVNLKHGLQLSACLCRYHEIEPNSHTEGYDDLHQYSVENWDFWKDLWEFGGVIYSVPPSKIIVDRPQNEVPEFFPGARLNYAENIIKRNGDSIAVTAARETGSLQHYTQRELRGLVRDMSNAMRAHGVKPHDRIAAVITNSIHALVVALAAATVGAMFSSTAPDMGASGILDRYRQVTPKLLFVDTEVMYAGKKICLVPKIEELGNDLSSGHGLENVILIPSTVTGKYPDAIIPHSMTLDDFLAPGKNGELVFEQLPFNHPFWILYSSGTSGPPKCIVHSAGGTLIQALNNASYGFNTSQDDCILQYTTTGWMMFASVVGTLVNGSRAFLYDGSPFYPDVGTFLKLASDQGVSVLGIGPRYCAELQGAGIKPLDIAPFPSLRAIFVTGAVLTAPMYRWIYDVFPPYIYLLVGSGGTDVCCAFVTGVPVKPVYAGEMQAKALGMKVEVFDPEGRNIEHTGTPGELVCTRAHPSLPLYFWNDKDGKKFQSAYFSVYPGVWAQGDFMVVNPVTKGLKILGRSDGVLNPSGVRFGSSEIYGVLERFSSQIDDALCVGQRRPHDMDERVLLFIKMRPGYQLTRALEGEIRMAIRTALSKRHEPSYVFEVTEIPYTVNNKKIEIAVKQIVSGSTVKPSGTVANPEAFNQYYQYVGLEKIVKETKRTPRAKL
ncbi:acetoacetate-CoA ligase [Gautieria morchelliformis]|nr:acetoacetate-CoA ligase [Gautieria morchelliformis]